jgi:integrase
MASILKVRPGVYRVRWCVSRDARGRQITGSRTVHGTKREAQRVKREVEHEIDAGKVRPNTELTVERYLRRWLDDEVAVTNAPRTQYDYGRIVERQLIPELGPFQLRHLRAEHVLGLRKKLLDSGGKNGAPLSKRRVQYVLAVLKKALSDAVQFGLVAENVAKRVKLPRPDRKPVEPLGVDRLKDVAAAIRESSIEPVIGLLVWTGLRRGEAMALRWQDVDLEASVLFVRRSMQRITGRGILIAPTKRHRSDRAVDLDPLVVRILTRHRARQAEHRLFFGPAYRDEDLVFCWEDGRRRDPTTVLKEFRRKLIQAGIEPVTMHQLRHTQGSLLALAGVNPKVIQERLGHATVQVTLDNYIHLMPGQQRDATKKLGAMLRDVFEPAVDAELTRPAKNESVKSA